MFRRFTARSSATLLACMLFICPNPHFVSGPCMQAAVIAGDTEPHRSTGIPNAPDPDCNNNGVADNRDIAGGTSEDCNADGIPDECGVAVRCEVRESQKITAGDIALGDRFGFSVSISGDLAIAGAAYDVNVGVSGGSAYIFRFDGDAWFETAKLTASDAGFGDRFGQAVSINGDLAAVGAPYDDDAGDASGSAYIFRYDRTAWTEVVKLKALDARRIGRFGRSVSISGDTLIVGASYDVDGGSRNGSAYVFQRDWGGPDNWGEVTKLMASDSSPDDRFGESVCISGDNVIIGASGQTIFSGGAYIYGRDEGGNNNWGEVARLNPSDKTNLGGFGIAVSISTDSALVGAPYDDDAGSFSGSAYIFRFDGAAWIETAKLSAPYAQSGDVFGNSVSFSGETAIVGSSRSVYVFRDSWHGWANVATLTPSDDVSSASVAISGEVVLVGAPRNESDSYEGAAYVFGLLGEDCTCNGAANLCDIARGDPDANWNTVPDQCDPDCNENQNPDFADISSQASADCNSNGIPDECEIDAKSQAPGGPFFCVSECSPDCNHNGVPDDCEPDCNSNDVADSCDIADATSGDCNFNGVPDECEPDEDCNGNGTRDICDIGETTSDDCNQNSIPDECELDCNDNSVPDDCDIASVTSDDCNENGVPDECESDCNVNHVEDDCDISSGLSLDCNVNGVPDECEPDEDCNENGIQDVCDIWNGSGYDCNVNGPLDQCEFTEGRLFRVDLPGLLGSYAGFVGISHETEFDFGREFAVVRGAWLRLTAYTYWQPVSVEAAGILDGVSGGWAVRLADPDREFCVPLVAPDSVLDGAGVVKLMLGVLACCDWSVDVTSATLWFDAIALPAPVTLLDFAEFQRCYGEADVLATPRCGPLDYDLDADVDLDDYYVFQQAIRPPGAE